MKYLCDFENREAKEMLPGVKIRTFWGKEMLLSLVDLDANTTVPMHSHLHEQAGTIISGELEMTINGEKRLFKDGDTYIIPGNVQHEAVTGNKPAQILDIFSPVREEYKY
ncbi:MAG: cupin domain-containing protein [Ignavibacteriaceae bacterium]|jgi:quercetin dioxygenase-like cupin family protein